MIDSLITLSPSFLLLPRLVSAVMPSQNGWICRIFPMRCRR